MNYHELLEHLKDFESESVECKSSFKEEEFGRTMAAFSTKKGGTIFLGVKDNGDPEGIFYNQKLKDRITQVSRVCSPPVNIDINKIKHDNEKFIICVKIPQGNGSIYSYKNVSYERREGVNHPLTPDEIIEREKRAKKIHFDQMPAKSFDRPALINDINHDLVINFLKKHKGIYMSKDTLDVKQFLTNHELSVNGSGKVRNAAILLFGKNPSQFIPQNKISISIFPTSDVSNEFIKSEVTGDLESLFRKTHIEILRNVRNYSLVRGTERIDVSEYPPEAIREAIINAIVHRDYFIEGTEIFVKIFKDRIEIVNPGGFPFAGYSWDEIEDNGLSLRRNPVLALFFEKMSLMEQEGHGIKRIKNAMKKHGLRDPAIHTTQNTFKIILYGPEDVSKIVDSPYKRVRDSSLLNDRQVKVLKHLKPNGSVNRAEYCKLLGVPEKTATRDLKGLVQQGFLKQTGQGKGTRYSIA